MKKVLILAATIMIVFSSMAYAEGDKNCGDEGSGSTGTIENGTGTGEQDKTQYRLPILWLLEIPASET